jgi:quercetin dioxygenase-like cupin family protein
MEGFIPFHTTHWESVPASKHGGIHGTAMWRSIDLGKIRIRLVEYSPDYVANHWCARGHILYCLCGEMNTTLDSGEVYSLNQGMSYQVSSNASNHRTESKTGALLFVVDGEFLDVQHKPIERNPWRM